MNTSLRHHLAALALSLLSASLPAMADAYPSKPIRVIVPFPPGGGTDVLAREITQQVGASTGWNFVVENRPGAGGNLGVDLVAKAPGDGYTLVLGQTSNLAINATLYAKLPYDPRKDLAPIALVADAPLVIVVPAVSPYKTLGELVAAARAKPGTLNFASPGNGTVAHLTGEMLQRAAGVKFQHVPYKGTNQAMTDVISNQVQLYIASIPSMMGFVKQGKVRPLAVTSARRVDDLPQVPTVAESGFKGFDATTWFGFAAPASTPKDILARLNAEFNKALQAPDMRKKLADQGAVARGGSADQFSALINADIPRWGKVVKESGATVD